MGGIAFGQLVGYLLDHGFGYDSVFALAGTFHVAAFLLILATIPVVRRHCALQVENELVEELDENYGNSHARRRMARQDRSAAAAFLHQPDGLAARCRASSMGTFTFHGWLIVEIFTDDGLVGIGNAALVAAASPSR